MMPIMLIYWTKWLTFLKSLCGNSIISKIHVSHNLDANKFVVPLDLKFQIVLIVVENNVDFFYDLDEIPCKKNDVTFVSILLRLTAVPLS